ncbi:patatin-like protein [Cyanobacteria bacterium FACHB-DQ100]|nr:patatin-like protein [Cyanobacteria bacterium FACHB-DQ100]
MSSHPPLLEKIEFQQEFRLGLVVYGGVSLAIYMNGVCREFYNAVRGRGIYKLIKALTDSDIIVDVVSGTSAGGINGVLLSYALTNSDRDTVVDFKNFADIWREDGDISKLLRNLKQKDIDSLLDGEEYYQNQLEAAFQKAFAQKPPAEPGEWFSESKELDLFVTGTDTLGKVYQAFDNTGCIIEVKDHRAVFLLKHREGRKHPFQPSPVTHQALAKLCRITSCFPVAFPVVSVELPPPPSTKTTKTKQADWTAIHTEAEEVSKIDPIDQRLVRWGALADRALPEKKPEKEGYQLHFVDGGVLDNRPFSYTIDQIYRRTAYRPVNRKLFYIDPSPDQFLGSLKFNQMSKPSIWEAALDSLVGMPRYESIANDLNEIQNRNEKVRRYKFLRGTAERSAERAEEQQKPSEMQPRSSGEPTAEEVYLRCRLVGLRDRILPLMLKAQQVDRSDPKNDSPHNQQRLLEKTAEFITQYSANPKEQIDRDQLLHELGYEIRNLEVDYARRKHFFLLEKLCQWMEDPAYERAHQKLRQLAFKIKSQMELLIVIQAGLEEMLSFPAVSDRFLEIIRNAGNRDQARKPIYDYLLRLHRFLLDANCLPEFDPESDQRFLNTSEVDRPEQAQPSAKTAPNFFKTLPGSLFSGAETESEWSTDLISSRISGVLAQLRKRSWELLSSPDKLDSAHSDSIWNSQYNFDRQENQSLSILFLVEEATAQLIQESDLEEPERKRLLRLFKCFRNIDQSVYAYEYLSGLQAKEQLEIFRISPNDAQLGFSRRLPENKLAGDQLRAFGGFFKKNWRSNDILWGRLDGLNRIVEATLTPESLMAPDSRSRFSHFLNRQCDTKEARADYIDQLVEETLPEATPTEKKEIKKTLQQMALGEILQDQDGTNHPLKDFWETLVTAAHRSILKSDLGCVLEDAIADQLAWSQQAIPSKAGDVSYQCIKIPSSSDPQLKALQIINQLLDQLLHSRTRQNIARYLSNQSKSQSPKECKKYFDRILKASFPASEASNRQIVTQYLQEFIKSPDVSIHSLYGFLEKLLEIGKAEMQSKNASPTSTTIIGSMNEQVDKALKCLRESIKPKFCATDGYLDQAVTPFAVKELVKAPLEELLNDQEKLEHYFRNQYQVGAEKAEENIPRIILAGTLARVGLVLRNILESPPAAQYVRNNPIFQVLSRLIQAFYWWVQAGNPKTSLIPVSFRSLVAFLLPILAIAGVAFFVSQLPVQVLVLGVTLILLQLINRFTGRFGLPQWASWLLIVVAVISLIALPYFAPNGAINWAAPFTWLRERLHLLQMQD